MLKKKGYTGTAGNNSFQIELLLLDTMMQTNKVVDPEVVDLRWFHTFKCF